MKTDYPELAVMLASARKERALAVYQFFKWLFSSHAPRTHIAHPGKNRRAAA